MTTSSAMNPLLEPWSGPHGLPPFARIEPDHFPAAFEAAMREHRSEIDAITNASEAPTFGNTIAAIDAAGQAVFRLSVLFENLAASATSPALQAVEREWSPRLAAHGSAIYQNEALFARVAAVYAERESLALTAEQLRLLERFYLDFERAGATLAPQAKARFVEIVGQLAGLTAQFRQNVLGDEAAFALTLSGDELAGLPASLLESAREAARVRGLPEGTYAITLAPSLAEPFLAFSERRDLRERLWHARKQRGAHDGERDNRPVAARIIALRQEQAALLGYATYADFRLADRMARTAKAANDLLMRAWQPALVKAEEDRAALTELARELGQPTPIAAWDWMYLADKLRQKRFAIDDAQIKPYFPLEAMIAAMFDCASRLFGLRFTERHDVTLYHADARLWEVTDSEGKPVGVFIGDPFARPTKRSGAWMSILRAQSGLNGGTLPIVLNTNNFAKGARTLLSFEDIRTLFHEFGHGLHGLLSNVHYHRLSGTNVLMDFVELPSQMFENWAHERDVLRRHARHIETGEPIPEALLDRLEAASRFNQAYATVEYAASALIDMAVHSLPRGEAVDIAQFQVAYVVEHGVPPEIDFRHRPSHFQHMFGLEHYAAGYYVYLWADVLVADGYAAFEEAGDPFDRATAERLHKWIYSSGNSIDPALAYERFRGRAPAVEPVLKKRGLL